MPPPLVDRDTALGVIIGGALGARGWSFTPVLAVTLIGAAFATVASRDPSNGVRGPTNAARFATDTAAALAAWWAGRQLFGPPPRRLNP